MTKKSTNYSNRDKCKSFLIEFGLLLTAASNYDLKLFMWFE